MKKVKNIAVLTSGGDAPGMNAAIRAVVRTGIYHKLNVFGVMYGYRGMIQDDIVPMDSKSVANIIQRGGTILKTARSKEFFTPEGRKKAYENLKKRGVDGLVVIGGDGSFKGAHVFSQEFGIPCIGLPGTIDKDISGTDFTIGFDTAANTAISAIDKIRDTADAHDRLFIVEVMGRDAGYIALYSGLATGAEHIMVPERPSDIENIVAALQDNERRKKLVNIIVVAEGCPHGSATEMAEVVRREIPSFDTRVCILGHIQRGGSPSCMDRIIASRLGYAAVKALLEGKYQSHMAGVINNEVRYTPFEQAIKTTEQIGEEWFGLYRILAS
ncbi:6-phosphofructokinase [Compostibacter hankyongensis]|uniref:ATP-dependent 6-phosphofructokinase n=1 Tax=Compostibacter hankyongensis TaxID=1007089 RepID=A0ABP8FRZ8_9BACT